VTSISCFAVDVGLLFIFYRDGVGVKVFVAPKSLATSLWRIKIILFPSTFADTNINSWNHLEILGGVIDKNIQTKN
jgi:hypothetical protein